MSELVLSCFPGIGLLDMAFELEGFCVVRGPDTLWGGDVKHFNPPAGRFDGIIAGPPCQAFSRLRHIVEHNVKTKGYRQSENLIPEFERVVSEARPTWFLMENVPDAPEPVVAGYVVRSLRFNNRWTGEEQNRVRRFSFGTSAGLVLNPEIALFESSTWEPAVVASGGSRPVTVAIGGSGKRKKTADRDMGYVSGGDLARAIRLQGLPDGFLDDAPFTLAGKTKVVGNGVPLPTGRVMARAVRRALGLPLVSSEASA